MQNDFIKNNTQNTPQSRERKWISIDQAYLLCQEQGLNRTKKTIRSWCRNEHIEGEKQTTSNGERWMIELPSLHVKIKSELEFQKQNENVRFEFDRSDPVQTTDEQVRTNANMSEPVRSGADQFEPSEENTSKIDKLKRKVQSLEIDKAVRDSRIEFITKQNEEGQRSLMGQSRYIGHLETKLMQLGGKPDQTFLAPPTDSTKPETEYQNPAHIRLGVD